MSRLREFALGTSQEGAGVAARNDGTDDRRLAATGSAGLHEGQTQLGGHRHLIAWLLLTIMAVIGVWAAQPILLRPWLPAAESEAGQLAALGGATAIHAAIPALRSEDVELRPEPANRVLAA